MANVDHAHAHDDHGISHVASMKVLLGTGGSLLLLTIVTVLATKVDFGANISGALQAFICVKPLVRDAKLIEILEARFKAVLQALVPYRKGADFVSYATVPLAERK